MPPSCFVATIDLSLRAKLESDLQKQGFSIKPLPHGFFSAKKTGVSCNLYLSGKLTVQGKGKEDFIAFYLEPEILGSLEYTHPQIYQDPSPRIGLDEAGKGDFFGPLCLAGIFVPKNGVQKLDQLGVKDSKKLQDNAIIEIAKKLRISFPYQILCLFPETYNKLYAKFHNLNQLLGWGHATLLEKLRETTGCKKAILDQFATPDLMARIIEKKKLDVDLVQRVRAEEDPVVAAASILARAAFVEGIASLEKKFSLSLPKGASSLVIQAGKVAIAQEGKDILPKISKTHFKTTDALLC